MMGIARCLFLFAVPSFAVAVTLGGEAQRFLAFLASIEVIHFTDVRRLGNRQMRWGFREMSGTHARLRNPAYRVERQTAHKAALSNRVMIRARDEPCLPACIRQTPPTVWLLDAGNQTFFSVSIPQSSVPVALPAYPGAAGSRPRREESFLPVRHPERDVGGTSRRRVHEPAGRQTFVPAHTPCARPPSSRKTAPVCFLEPHALQVSESPTLPPISHFPRAGSAAQGRLDSREMRKLHVAGPRFVIPSRSVSSDSGL